MTLYHATPRPTLAWTKARLESIRTTITCARCSYDDVTTQGTAPRAVIVEIHVHDAYITPNGAADSQIKIIDQRTGNTIYTFRSQGPVKLKHAKDLARRALTRLVTDATKDVAEMQELEKNVDCGR